MQRFLRMALVGGIVLASACGLTLQPPKATADSTDHYLVGRGIADITGEAAENGLMGYGMFDQQSSGIHSRQHSRAFVIASADNKSRVLYVVTETAMTFESIHQTVLDKLSKKFGNKYNYQNTMIVASHTHGTPGGYSHHLLYNITTIGFHQKTFDAQVDGIVESVVRADADVKKTSLSLGTGTLKGASQQRSAEAFKKNKPDLQQAFPDMVDSATTNLMIKSEGKLTGVVNWFGVHATSMSNENKLVTTDNKGYAAWTWEKQQGMDYLSKASPNFISAFAQNNTGDMSPNLDLKPPHTPGDFQSTKANGDLQLKAAQAVANQGGKSLSGPVDSRIIYLDFDNLTVSKEFTGDGKSHTTCEPVAGASMAAGSLEDGPAGPGFFEGKNNPFWEKFSQAAYKFDPAIKECQAPKDMMINGGVLNAIWPWLQTRLPLQMIRIGQFYILGYPGELSIGASYRIREAVASIVKQPIENVMMSSYANAYSHYMTTPEEYDTQNYEGGSTLFGRWQNPAMVEQYSKLATAMAAGQPVEMGPGSPDLSGFQLKIQPGVVLDVAAPGHSFGDVLQQPAETVAKGNTVTAIFAGAHPKNDLKDGATYIEVQRLINGKWERIADDNSWDTKLRWERVAAAQSKVTITWDVPTEADSGEYRIVYHGNSLALGVMTPFTGASQSFKVN